MQRGVPTRGDADADERVGDQGEQRVGRDLLRLLLHHPRGQRAENLQLLGAAVDVGHPALLAPAFE